MTEKKEYTKPEVKEVKLAHEEAVLQSCKSEPGPVDGTCIVNNTTVAQTLGS